MTTFRRILSRTKVRQSRGSGWVQIVFNMGIITANVALFEVQFAEIGLSEFQAIALLCSSYIVGTVVIGYLDEKYGIWQFENEFNTNLNPFFRKIREEVEDIQDRIK
jgi:hypothetical protein